MASYSLPRAGVDGDVGRGRTGPVTGDAAHHLPVEEAAILHRERARQGTERCGREPRRRRPNRQRTNARGCHPPIIWPPAAADATSILP
jgi:hypothetical protein